MTVLFNWGFFWGHSHSDWLPVSVLGYMEFFLAPKREVGPDSHYALLWRASKGYNAGSFWLGRVHLGLAPHSPVFPSVLNFNEWQLHEQCSSVATVKMIFEQMKKSTEKLSDSETKKNILWCPKKEHSKPVTEGASLKPSELNYSSCRAHYQLVTTDAPWSQWPNYSVSHVFSFSHCPSELLWHSLSHPLILPLCLCEEACLPAGPEYRDARLKSPRGERFLNLSCPPGLMQCISLSLGVFVGHSRRFITSDPSNNSLWASHPTYNPAILWVLLSCHPGQSNRGTEYSQVFSVVITDNCHTFVCLTISEQTPWQTEKWAVIEWFTPLV